LRPRQRRMAEAPEVARTIIMTTMTTRSRAQERQPLLNVLAMGINQIFVGEKLKKREPKSRRWR